MDNMIDLLDLRHEIMERVENILKKAKKYQRNFDSYTHLWQDDRAECLRQFLLYGHVLTAEEMGAYGAEIYPESMPTIDNFKEQVQGYLNHHIFPLYGRCLNCILCYGFNFTDRLL